VSDTQLQPTRTTDETGYKRVSPEQAAHIIKLRQLNPDATQAEIAAAVGTTQGTVSRWLAQFEVDTTEEAKKYYAANQLRAAQAVIDRLESEDERTVLRAAELAHKVGKLLDGDNTIKVGVQVVLGVPANGVTFASEDQ
jgi:molybdopterin synthase catalytic subunit